MRPNTAAPTRSRVLSLLWFPFFFAAAMTLTYMFAFSHPQPHGLIVGVVGTQPDAAAVQASLDRVRPDGFVVAVYGDARSAGSAVADGSLAAALTEMPQGRVLVASAASATRADYLGEVLDGVAPGAPVVDVHPVQDGDVTGVGLFFYGLPLLLVGMITSIVLLQLGPWPTRSKAVAILATGAFASSFAYAIAVGRDVLPADARLLIWGLVLTQTMGWLTTATALVAKQYFMPIAMTFVLILGIPTSGATVAADMLPAPLRQLHAGLPFGQFIDLVRAQSLGVGQAVTPAAVLLAWAAAGAAALFWAHTRAHANSSQTTPASEAGPGTAASDLTSAVTAS